MSIPLLPADGPVVRVTGGDVRGLRAAEPDGIDSWRGIPYAAPPVGELRFRAPAPVVAWSGIRDATSFGLMASQQGPVRVARSTSVAPSSGEDCLTINVHAPAERGSKPLPVMVFIHGGGYTAGSSRDFSGQGEEFVRTGRVVFVSFNYRLGALGYLDFTRYASRQHPFQSNLGLRDQVAALRWVRDNIAAFDGDPNQVTVFGESAGGNAVTTLMAVPAARGLFARAIAQSPPPHSVYARKATGQWAGEFVGMLRQIVSRRQGAGSSVTRDVPALLAGASTVDLLAAAEILRVRTPITYPGAFPFAPVVDGDFLPESPLVAFREGRAHRIPLIVGTNDREGSIFRGRVDILPRTPARIRALFARAPETSHAPMRAAYPGIPGRRSGADFGADYGFWYPSTRVTDFHSRYAATFAYRFDFAPRLLKLVGLHATHGVEMFALFGRADEPIARAMTSLGGYEQYVAAGERMRGFWLNFAERSEPGPEWPCYSEATRSTLIIDAVDRVVDDPRAVRRRAWNDFLPELAG
ncbi:carboxylesterase/lipase family protein [Microbacterium rhizomatis]|uniref:carboxylesterase/lipase family protein n=1 Tax=Microbacterium rhizomatis TaxID=1631477 RepID=UPI001B87D57F|nr:carboxylesterase/lipase family protein [Microbacterium rhizomatis]